MAACVLSLEVVLAYTLVCLLVLLAWLFLLANLLLACLWRLTSERNANELTNGFFYGAVSYKSMYRSWYSPVGALARGGG